MSPIEKAKDLTAKYKTVLASHFMLKTQLASYAKGCALIAVDEILSMKRDFDIPVAYYQQVKEEIEKL